MLFNSPEFVVFCLLVYVVYLGSSFRFQNYMLLLASYIFYGWWDVRFLFLVALSTTVDFWVGLMIENGQLSSRQWLAPARFLIASAVAFLGLNPAALAWGHLDLRALIRAPLIGWAFVGSIAFITFISFLFFILSGVDDARRRLSCLMFSLITQLGLLGVFKYFNFFVDSLSDALTTIGIQSSSLHLPQLSNPRQISIAQRSPMAYAGQSFYGRSR
jgi:D-alanyl-lipoteichoic acid acyltransferase DltB (MBOAT superfamily)